jgi:hypothetical protein
VTSSESVNVWYEVSVVRAHRSWPNPTSATETPAKRNSRPSAIRGIRNADCKLEFFFMSLISQRVRSC